MKKTIIMLTFALINVTAFCQGQFKINTNQYIQIGYAGYKALTFGQSTGSSNNGNFAIEHCSDCTPQGFNLFKPWPTAYANNYLLFIKDDGNVGIGKSNPTYKLDVEGTVRAYSFATYSDERLKKNFKRIEKCLDKLSGLEVYEFDYKIPESTIPDSVSLSVDKKRIHYNNSEKSKNSKHFGFKAQDIQKIYPELVSEDEDGIMSVNYMEFIPLLIQGMREQNERIKELEAQVKILGNNKK